MAKQHYPTSSHSVLCRLWVFAALMINVGISQTVGAATLTTIKVGDTVFQVEIARTVQERQQGLMFRRHLPESHGMLFIQPEPAPTAFWMKNTYIPLDLLYFDEKGSLVEIFANVPPCKIPPCPTYLSRKAIKFILEINGGTAEQLGIKVGERLFLP